MEDRITRNMGAVDLVLKPHRAERGFFLASVTRAGTDDFDNSVVEVSPVVAANLRMEAEGQFFDAMLAAWSWLTRRAAELDRDPNCTACEPLARLAYR